MHGEEGGATGYQLATVVTGPDAGKSYVLGKFNLSTNGSGLDGVGAWENALASPYPQDKTIVIGNSDGGTGIMTNAVAVYVGTKQTTGTEVDKAGLTNGTLKFVNVDRQPGRDRQHHDARDQHHERHALHAERHRVDDVLAAGRRRVESAQPERVLLRDDRPARSGQRRPRRADRPDAPVEADVRRHHQPGSRRHDRSADRRPRR